MLLTGTHRMALPLIPYSRPRQPRLDRTLFGVSPSNARLSYHALLLGAAYVEISYIHAIADAYLRVIQTLKVEHY